VSSDFRSCVSSRREFQPIVDECLNAYRTHATLVGIQPRTLVIMHVGCVMLPSTFYAANFMAFHTKNNMGHITATYVPFAICRRLPPLPKAAELKNQKLTWDDIEVDQNGNIISIQKKVFEKMTFREVRAVVTSLKFTTSAVRMIETFSRFVMERRMCFICIWL
jgi:hypothetical protein